MIGYRLSAVGDRLSYSRNEKNIPTRQTEKRLPEI
jgi:hypothetical protein